MIKGLRGSRKSRHNPPPPSRPHPSMLPSHMDSQGHIMNDRQMSDKNKKAGMCDKCGLVQTHKKILAGLKRVPMTVDRKVYKGYCLSCYSMTTAKTRLGEAVDRDLDLRNTASNPVPHQKAPSVTHPETTLSRGGSHGSGRNNLSPPASPGLGNHGGSHQARSQHSNLSDTRSNGNKSRGDNNNNNSAGGGYAGRDNGRALEPISQVRDNAAAPGGDYLLESRHHPVGVPHEVDADDMTVMSEISMDPSFLPTNHRGIDHETSLSNIVEEDYTPRSSNDVSSSQDNDQDNNNTSSSSYQRSHSNNNTSFSADQRSHGRTPSVGSGNQSRVGSHAVKSGENSAYENLLARKIRGEDNNRKVSGNATANGGSDSTGSDQKPSSAANNNGHVHFRENDSQNRRNVVGSAASRLEGQIKGNLGMAGDDDQASHARSHSEGGILTPPTSQAGHQRSVTDSGTMPGVSHQGGAMSRMLEERIRQKTKQNDMLTTKRSMSNEGSSISGDRSIGADSSNRSAGTSSVTPRVQSVNKSEEKSLLQKKLDRENALKGKKDNDSQEAVANHGAMDDNMSVTEARSLISDCSSCADLLDFLKKNSSSTQAVVLMALRKLRDCLLLAHFPTEGVNGITSHFRSMSMDSLESSARSKMAFPNGGWTKILMVIMTSNESNAIVQSELLRTLWSIVPLHPRYTSDLMSNPDMKQVITIMESMKDESVQEYGCGLIACIAGTETYAKKILKMSNGKFIQRLMSALYFDSSKQGNVQENAFKALFRLSYASLSSSVAASSVESTPSPTDSFAHMMGTFAKDSKSQAGNPPPVKAIATVLDVMEHYPTNISVQIHGNRLLWNIFSPDVVVDPYHVDILVDRTLKHIKGVMTSHQDSQAFHETTICLLSKLSCYGSDSLGREAFLFAAADTMRGNPHSGIVALHGCRTLANVCTRSSELSLSQHVSEDGITAIISCMGNFDEHIMVQSEACAALCAVCINSPPNKVRVQELDGIDKIVGAFETYSMTPYKDQWLTTKIRACVALTTLGVDPMVLSDIQNKGIITKFERILTEDSKNIPYQLRCAIQGLVNLTFDVENTDDILVFRYDAGEEEMCECLRANLSVIKSPDFAVERIGYLRSSAIRAMEKFVNSTDIHEIGCKLLACAFAKASEEGGEGEQDHVDLEEELEAITTSLAHHKNNPVNAAAASSALQNFATMLTLSNDDLAIAINVPDMTNLLSRSVQEVINDLVIHREDEQNLIHATGALQALCSLREGLAITFESDSTIGSIVEGMNRYPNSGNLQRHGIGILGLFFMVSDNVMDFFNDVLVAAIIRVIQKEVDNDDAADLVDTAINIFLIMANKGFQAVKILLRNERLIDTVVTCMWRYPSHPSIQSAGIDILSNIALDNFLRADVCQRGGTSRIIAALDKLKHDPTVVIKAHSALANLISGANAEILRAPDAPATRLLVDSLAAHPANLGIQINGAFALWALSARNDSFKDELVNVGGAEVVSNAMARFVGSKPMQAKGFVVIWSLAVPRHLKLRVGRCAIEPTVNGFNAHFSNPKICEEALGCIKCLSTIPVNKEMLEDNGAVDLIYSCMWLHSENPEVCKGALAALCNISVNVETNEVSEITTDDLDVIVNTMRTHRSVRALQSSAIILLRNFTFSRTNVMVLERNNFVGPLVRSAMSHFNDNFQGRADDLLRALPTTLTHQ